MDSICNCTRLTGARKNIKKWTTFADNVSGIEPSQIKKEEGK